MKTKKSPAATRMLWSQIQDFYQGEWVEIIDCKWNKNSPFPAWGTVRNHAADRNELISRMRKQESSEDSIILYLGVSRSSFEHSLSAAV